MNPIGGHSLYKVPPGLDMPPRGPPVAGKPVIGGGVRIGAIASKFTVKQEPVDVTMATPVDLYLCQTGKGEKMINEKNNQVAVFN